MKKIAWLGPILALWMSACATTPKSTTVTNCTGVIADFINYHAAQGHTVTAADWISHDAYLILLSDMAATEYGLLILRGTATPPPNDSVFRFTKKCVHEGISYNVYKAKIVTISIPQRRSTNEPLNIRHTSRAR